MTQDQRLTDSEIERLAAEYIAADWTPDRYYRDMNLIAFARALLQQRPLTGREVTAVSELSIEEAVALVREKAWPGYGYGPKGSSDEFARCYALSPLQLAAAINAALASPSPDKEEATGADGVGAVDGGKAG